MRKILTIFIQKCCQEIDFIFYLDIENFELKKVLTGWFIKFRMWTFYLVCFNFISSLKTIFNSLIQFIQFILFIQFIQFIEFIQLSKVSKPFHPIGKNIFRSFVFKHWKFKQFKKIDYTQWNISRREKYSQHNKWSQWHSIRFKIEVYKVEGSFSPFTVIYTHIFDDFTIILCF